MAKKGSEENTYKQSGKTFVNPYTFVPVNFSKATDKANGEREVTDGITGRIVCRLRCETPIAIPGESHKPKSEMEEGESLQYKFFRVDGEPVIPGSSLRGVIRNVFETITDSCFRTLKPDTRLTYRTLAKAKDVGEPGVLIRDENNNWSLYTATRHKIRTDTAKRYAAYNGKEIGFSSRKSKNRYDAPAVIDDSIKVKKEEIRVCSHKGYLFIGEAGPKKTHESIFEPKEVLLPTANKKMIDVAMSGLEATCKQYYRNKSINKEYDKTHFGYADYEKMKDAGILPVWYFYEKEKRKLLLSLAAIGRVAFSKSLNDHVRGKKPCTSRKQACAACRVFGMIGEKPGSSMGSRVRFTDASPEDRIEFDTRWLLELATPHPSYMPFYSTTKLGKYGRQCKYPGYDDGQVTIRGRKFYWHSDQFYKNNEDVPENGRNVKMEVAKEESEFRFSVYFENLQDTELETLIWSLNLGENRINGRRMHKIGHGKPIGLGSVKVVVESVETRMFDAENAYRVQVRDVSEKADRPEGTDEETVNALLTVCDFYAQEGKDVRYPYIVGDEKLGADGKVPEGKEAYNWFGENRTVREKQEPKDVVQLLPDIREMQELKALEMCEGKKSTGANNKSHGGSSNSYGGRSGNRGGGSNGHGGRLGNRGGGSGYGGKQSYGSKQNQKKQYDDRRNNQQKQAPSAWKDSDSSGENDMTRKLKELGLL